MFLFDSEYMRPFGTGEKHNLFIIVRDMDISIQMCGKLGCMSVDCIIKLIKLRPS